MRDFYKEYHVSLSKPEVQKALRQSMDYVGEKFSSASITDMEMKVKIGIMTKRFFIRKISEIAAAQAFWTFGANAWSDPDDTSCYENPIKIKVDGETVVVRTTSLSELDKQKGVYWKFDVNDPILKRLEQEIVFAYYDDEDSESSSIINVFPAIKVKNLKIFKPKSEGFEGYYVVSALHLQEYINEVNEKINNLF